MKYWNKEVNGFMCVQKPIEYITNENGEQVVSPSYEPYPEYTDEQVDALFKQALEQNATIADINGVPTLISRPAPTQDELNKIRIAEIQARLTELDHDIVQDIAGEIVPNIEERKAEFVTLHNELRVLLGKEERALKNITNNLA